MLQPAATADSLAPLAMFLLYTSVVLTLAWLAHRRLAGRGFLSEYFLGSRGLGAVALALTFGATSASAGSFAGFPSLIYSHGWSLALWIASYMIFPLCGMGLLGKRLNRIARQTGAITLPDVLRERFESRALGLVSTLTMALLLTVYLIPQCTLGALIVRQLLGDLPLYRSAASGLAVLTGDWLPAAAGADYLLALLLFAALVVVYTTVGGFRAVVWTDVLQGLVMLAGVWLMLLLALTQTGGLAEATAEMARMTPPRLGRIVFESSSPAPAGGYRIDSDVWIEQNGPDGEVRLFRTNQSATVPAGRLKSLPVKAVQITSASEIERIRSTLAGAPAAWPAEVAPRVLDMNGYARGAGQPGVYLRPPGPSASEEAGFLPLGLAFSFFVFWALSGTGQPGNMVRLMAFDSTRSLRRAIAGFSVYTALIYFPLVVIFCCARVLVPGLDQTPDRIMPVMAFHLTEGAGVPWLAGLIVAAPFAAAMSTVDSFMLMISSSLVRDVYQKNLRPAARERTLRRLSYLCTLLIGLVATLGALYPPRFLQYVIVFTGGGLAVAFLTPVALALYWPRFNRAGALAAMAGGLAAYLGLYLAGFVLYQSAIPVRPLGLDPLIWGFAGSLIAAVLASKSTAPPPERLVNRFFGG